MGSELVVQDLCWRWNEVPAYWCIWWRHSGFMFKLWNSERRNV